MNVLSLLLLHGGVQLSLISVGFAAKIVQALWADTEEFLHIITKALPNNPHNTDAALTLAIAKAATQEEDPALRIAGQQSIKVVVEKRPELADSALEAAKQGVLDKHDGVRDAARQALEIIVKKRPELTDATLAKVVATAASSQGVWDTRNAAQQTLGLILDKNPELADAALAVTKAAAMEGQEDIREAAQQTLEMIVKKRPELADDSLTEVVAQAAVAEEEWYIRKAALQTLGIILGKRPDLGAAALAVVKKLHGKGIYGAKALQQALTLIAEKCPDLH